MSDRDNDPAIEEAIDPPDNQGGGNSAVGADSRGDQASDIDPPDHQGGGEVDRSQ